MSFPDRRQLLGPWLAWAFRVTLGVVFIVASTSKIADPRAFAVSIANYHLVPTELINLMAICLPWVEMICGAALVLGVGVRPNLLVIEGLLLIFIVAISLAMYRQLDISCGCFAPATPSAATMTRWTLIWDVIWLLMGVHALIWDRELLAISRLWRRGANAEEAR